MNHARAARQLPAYAEGSLGGSSRARLAAHLDRCPACRGWLETYTLLAGAGHGSAAASETSHAESEGLARLAARPAEVDAGHLAALLEHLEDCTQCREELSLLTAATDAARTGSDDPSGSRLQASSIRRAWRGVAAAIFAVAALGLSLVLGLGLWPGPESTGSTEIDPGASEPVSSPAPLLLTAEGLFDAELEGTTAIHAEKGLRISRVKVTDGARISIRAGGPVAFGDGFQIGSGTRVSVGSALSAGEDRSGSTHSPDDVRN